MNTLGDALPGEISRVRDKVLPVFPEGGFAARLMRDALDRATKALAEQDVVAMLRCYEELNGFVL